MFGSGNNDVDGETEEDVNKANILVNEVSFPKELDFRSIDLAEKL